MPPHSVLFALLTLASFVFFGLNIRRLYGWMKIGKPANRFDRPLERMKNVLVVAFGQSKLLREPSAGIMHFFIFWGFVVLLLAIVESMAGGLVAGFSFAFLGPAYPVLAFLEDALAALVVCAVLFALFRRYVVKPPRLDVHGHARTDATLILGAIFLIMVSMLLQNATGTLLGEHSAGTWRVVSGTLVPLFRDIPADHLRFWYDLFWWIHILCVLGFLNYLPFSKHLHVVSSIPNVYFSKLDPRGSLQPLNLQDESAVRFGAADVEDLTWKQLLDGYTCTECGRCTAACPAALTGKPLSPKKIITDIRQRLAERAPLLLQTRSQDPKPPSPPPAAGEGKGLVGGYVTEDELWACTTCMACVEECPVQIEHIDAIVDMRRFLVLNESRFPKEMQATFQNLERNFTPWAFSQSSRADWAEGMDIPRLARKRDAGILFWVGCAGSYDARYQKVTRAFASILKAAGVDFAILGTEEKCNGDPARRAGNEYLAQMLMTENINLLNTYGVRKIVTTCPHCLNIFRNEYPALGGTYDVTHHTEFIADLLKTGKIRPRKEIIQKMTYHDSCYLGRYNQIYEEPRRALAGIPGLDLVEMPRRRDKGFCCGAGGARMFMEETLGKRINVERTEEALALKPDLIGTACPFCMTMMTDGVKMKEAADTVQVKDIAEIVTESLGL